MRNPLLCVFLVLLSLSGCSTLTHVKRIEQLERTTRDYQMILQASDFHSASGMLDEASSGQTEKGLDSLDNIRVTSYEVRKARLSDDKQELNQIVEIRYYKITGMLERSIIDEQLWKYDDKLNKWRLHTGLPKFE